MKRTKKLLCLLLASVMLLGLLPITTAADAAKSIYIRGVEVKKGEYLLNDSKTPLTALPDDYTGGYAYYDNDGVLTLNSYVYTGTENYQGINNLRAIIYSPKDLDIRLIGNSSLIKSNGESNYSGHGAGIGASGNITISGSGKLTIEKTTYGLYFYEKSKTVTINGGTLDFSTYYGIHGYQYLGKQKIIINGGTLDFDSWYYPLLADDIVINGGNCTFRVHDNSGMKANKTITINGGNVNVANTYGKAVLCEKLYINGGNVTVSGMSTALKYDNIDLENYNTSKNIFTSNKRDGTDAFLWNGSTPLSRYPYVKIEVVTADVTVYKTDDHGEALSGAGFTLSVNVPATETTAATTKVVHTAVSDEDGVAVFEDVVDGTYIMAETSAPAGYIKSADTYIITVFNGKVYKGAVTVTPGNTYEEYAPVTYENAAVEIVVHKTDDENNPLAGATFTLSQEVEGDTSSSTVVKYTAVSNEKGVAVFEKVVDGTYTLAESAAPQGYAKSATTYTLTVREGKVYNGTSEYAPVTYENTAVEIIVHKTDDNGNPLAGATFTLSQEVEGDTASSTVVKYTAVSDASGVAVFEKVADGTYTLAESAAPADYVKSSETYTLVVENGKVSYNGEAYTTPIVYVNEPVDTSVTFTIPFTKTVKRVALGDPDAQIFTFAVIPAGTDEELAISITGNTIVTNGVGTYEGLITITCPDEDTFDLLREGIIISEVDDHAEFWIYDKTSYTVYPETDDEGNVTVSGTVTFTNAYLNTEDLFQYKPSTNYYLPAVYDIHAQASDNGTVSTPCIVSTTNATVRLNIKPDAGYVLDELIVVGANGRPAYIINRGGSYSFVMPSCDVYIYASFVEAK